MIRKLPVVPLFIVKVTTCLILLSLANPAFCARRGIIVAFMLGYFSKSGLILGYGVTDRISIEAHFGANACATAAWSTTWGISAKYRPIADNEKFYLSAGWSKIFDESRFRRYYARDDAGNRYITVFYSSGLNLGLGREFSINQEVGFAKNVFWGVEGGLYLALKDEQWRITFKDGEEVTSKDEGDFFWRKSPFFHTGPIFYSKRE